MSVLLPTVEITRRTDSSFVDKENGTRVNYYLFPEFEIHSNTIAANTEQEWHHHTKIEEILFITGGTLTSRWLEANVIHEATLQPGDMIRVGASVHTFANRTKEEAYFLVFRYVPDGHDKHEIIKNDRFADKVEEHQS